MTDTHNKIPPTHRFALDGEVFGSYDDMRLARKDNTEFLTPPKDKKTAVLAQLREGNDVDLRAEHLDESILDAHIAYMKGWKAGLLSSSLDPEVMQLYRWRINEDIANIYMIRASQRGDMCDFARWNTFIYGEPNTETYTAAIDWVLNDAEGLEKTTEYPAVRQAARHVIGLMPQLRGDKSALVPNDDIFAAVRADHFNPGGFFDELLDGVEQPDAEQITRAEGEPILDYVLQQNLGGTYERGRAAGTAWSVNHQQHVLKQPDTYSMPWERFIGLPIGHEAGTHVKEAVNAQLGQLGLMVWGLDRFEQGAEGRALIREQVPYESFMEFTSQPRWRFILERKIAISYGLGVGEDGVHTSSEVYALISAIEYMHGLTKTPDDEARAREAADKRAADLVVRSLKGTDGTGGAYRKDEVYLDGNVRAWQAAAQRGEYAISEGDRGKYDIANQRHVDYLGRLAILGKQ